MELNRRLTFKRKLAYVAVASCFTAMPAFANPIGATVVNGQVSFAAQGNALTVTNTPNAIINWQQFSIGPGEITRFVQQSASSAVLNRVLGQDPSQILGSLLSNGRVFLVNPNGIVFGQGAVIDVAGLVASTLRLSDGDFLAGKLNFTNGAGAGGIDNQGRIAAPNGGNIYLIAPDIRNSGLITSPQGEILLAAGHTVNLVDAANPDVQVTLSAPDTRAVNIGTLMAQSGRIGIYGALIGQQGAVNADTAVAGANGRIMLRASKDITLEPGSVTTASGMAGGVRDGGEIRIVADGTLAMRQGSEVHVDGGADGGNGGFLELSGKTGLALRGSYSGRAHRAGYRNGALLLDPMNIVIGSSGSTLSSAGTGSYSYAASSGTSASVLNINKNMSGLTGWSTVSLTAGRDITLAAPLADGDLAAGVALALNAGHDINLNAAIGTSGARFNHDLTLTASSHVNFLADVWMGNNTLTAAGNSITVTPLAANQSVTVDVQGAIVFNANAVDIQGGTASNNLDAFAKVHGGTVTITAGGVLIQGGLATASVSDGGSDVVDASAELRADTTLSITTTSGGLTVRGGYAYATASCCSSSQTARATADARLISGGNMTLDIANGMTVQGGWAGASAYSYSNNPPNLSQAVATADALVSAGGSLGLTVQAGGLQVLGGGSSSGTHVYAYAYRGSNQVASANANATLRSNGAMTLIVTNGITVRGGFALASAYQCLGSSCSGSNTATAHADAVVQADGGLLGIAVQGGGLTVSGGSNARASAYSSGFNFATATANAVIQAAGNLEITDGAGGRIASVQISGGWAWTYAYGTSGSGSAAAHANASVTAGSLTLRTDSLIVRGGTNAHAEAGNAFSTVVNRSATAESKALLQVNGSVTAMDIGSGGMLVEAICNCGTALTYGAGGVNTATVDRSAFIRVTGDLAALTVAGGGVTVQGGNAQANVYGSLGVNHATEYANAGIEVGGTLQTGPGGIAGNFLLQGGGAFGSGARAYVSGSGSNHAVAHGGAEITAGAVDITVAAGNLTISGGSAMASASSGIASAYANALVTVTGAQIFNIAGNVNLTGGSASPSGPGATAQAITRLSSQAGGNAVVLAAGANFVNSAGATPISLTGGGRWLVYSADPASDTFGGLDSGNTAIWNATYASRPPAGVTHTGNRYLFGFQPTVTFTSLSLAKTYGADATAAVAASYSVSGLNAGIANAYLADSNATVFGGAPGVTSAGSAVSAAVSGSPYAITVAQGSLSALSGYAFAYQSTGLLTVDPLAVVLAGSKTYDGSTTFAAGQLSVGNIVVGDTVSLSAGTADTADSLVGSNKPFVSLTGLALTGASAGNYTLTGVSGAGTIASAVTALDNPTVIAAVDFGVGETNNSTTVEVFVPAIQFGDEGAKEKKDDIPVCN